jgi:curli biogenesis system outer membrane secretion channel CsgG
MENKMKLIAHQIWSFMLLAFLSGLLLGCASALSGSNIMEIADETEAQGCNKLGLVTGNSYWGGFTGQQLSLEVAKKRALDHAKAKGATRVLWLNMKKGFFGASVSGKAFACLENTNPIAENTDNTKIIPLSKSLTPKKEKALGYVAVMRFESFSIDSGGSMVITDIFTNQIQANGKYRVMERSQMNKILSEQGFQNSGACNSTECAVEIGRLLSIDKMFIGSIGKLGESWFINVRLIDIKTGEILSNLSKKVLGKVDNLSSAAIQMANEFSQ